MDPLMHQSSPVSSRLRTLLERQSTAKEQYAVASTPLPNNGDEKLGLGL
jgi:hypothetical protein